MSLFDESYKPAHYAICDRLSAGTGGPQQPQRGFITEGYSNPLRNRSALLLIYHGTY